MLRPNYRKHNILLFPTENSYDLKLEKLLPYGRLFLAPTEGCSLRLHKWGPLGLFKLLKFEEKNALLFEIVEVCEENRDGVGVVGAVLSTFYVLIDC